MYLSISHKQFRRFIRLWRVDVEIAEKAIYGRKLF